MKRIYVTSIDDVLRWLGIEYTQKLPDPEIVPDKFYEVPIMNSPRVSVYNIYPDFPESTTFKKIMYVKKEIMFEGRKLTVWSEA